MMNEVEREIKRQTRDQSSKLAQQIEEMERLTARLKADLQSVSEFGPSAMRSANYQGHPEQMTRIAAQMSKSTSALVMLAEMTDAANAGTCEEVGA